MDTKGCLQLLCIPLTQTGVGQRLLPACSLPAVAWGGQGVPEQSLAARPQGGVGG